MHAWLHPARSDKRWTIIMLQDKASASSASLDSMSAKAIALIAAANKRNKLKVFVHSLRFVEVLSVLITCFFVLQQTRIMSRQTEAMALQIQENAISNKLQVDQFLREHYQTINKVLAEQPEARNAFGLSIQQVMSYMLLADYDHIYQMFEEKMIDNNKWTMLEHFIRNFMTESKLPIKAIWIGDRGARSPGFESYVEACVYSELYESPDMNPNMDGMKETSKLRGRLTTRERIDIRRRDCPE